MSARLIELRVKSLERAMSTRRGKVYGVIGGRSVEDALGFIRSEGIEVSDADLIVHRVIVGTRGADPAPVRWR
jgi:hypothetical protein